MVLIEIAPDSRFDSRLPLGLALSGRAKQDWATANLIYISGGWRLPDPARFAQLPTRSGRPTRARASAYICLDTRIEPALVLGISGNVDQPASSSCLFVEPRRVVPEQLLLSLRLQARPAEDMVD